MYGYVIVPDVGYPPGPNLSFPNNSGTSKVTGSTVKFKPSASADTTNLSILVVEIDTKVVSKFIKIHGILWGF